MKRLEKFWLDHRASVKLSSMSPDTVAYCRMLFYSGAAAMVEAMDSDEQVAAELREEIAEEHFRADADACDTGDSAIATPISGCEDRAALISRSRRRLVQFEHAGESACAKLEREHLTNLQKETGPDA